MPGQFRSLIPRQSRREIHEYLFREGVCVVEKNNKLPSHPELEGIPNLHVWMALRSLKSKNYVDELYNWRHFYYTLNKEGIEFLRKELQIPDMVFPATHTRKVRAATERRPPREENERRGGGGGGRGRARRDNNAF